MKNFVFKKCDIKDDDIKSHKRYEFIPEYEIIEEEKKYKWDYKPPKLTIKNNKSY